MAPQYNLLINITNNEECDFFYVSLSMTSVTLNQTDNKLTSKSCSDLNIQPEGKKASDISTTLPFCCLNSKVKINLYILF